VTSSGLGCRSYAGILTYSCTKTFASFLAQGLSYELKGKVDCLDWECGETKTKMLGSRKGWTVIDTDVAVRGSLRDLGSANVTNGNYRHEVGMFFFSLVSLNWVNPFFNRIMEKELLKQIEIGRAEKKED